MNDKPTIQLIRSFLRSGVLENGLVSPPDEFGVPQGGPISPVLSNVYLDKLDKELESRGLKFCHYADDVIILVKSERAAERVMNSISTWIEKKLYLKINMDKSKVVRPSKAAFLGFAFWKHGKDWKTRPLPARKKNIYTKVREASRRKTAYAKSLATVFTEVNHIARGWINYYSLGFMKTHMIEFGEWLRHRMRMLILMQWKRPKTVYENLKKLNNRYHCGFEHEDFYKVANSSLGWYKKSCGNVVNFIISPKVLETGNKEQKRPGLINPLDYYSSQHMRFSCSLT